MCNREIVVCTDNGELIVDIPSPASGDQRVICKKGYNVIVDGEKLEFGKVEPQESKQSMPKQIKIGGYVVKVNKANNMVTDRRVWGEWHPRTQDIFIDEACTLQQKQETLLHEIMEAIDDFYDLDLDHHQISLIATVLHQVIKDNDLSFFYKTYDPA